MLSKKIFLSAALVSMAGLVACGDDSSSNSDSKELPKSVKTFMDLGDVECNADRKCETILVEEHNDTYQCDGVKQWDMLLDGVPSKVCPAKDEKKAEGEEKGEGEGDKTPESSASNSDSVNSGAASTDSNTGSANSAAASADSNTDSANSGEGSANSGEASASSGKEVTGPTGDLVSCSYTADGIKGGTYCDEVAASNQAMLAAQCDMFSGTMKTDGGCSQEGVKKKCTTEQANHYIYDGDETCPTDN